MLQTLYTSLVCPHLDYICVVWYLFHLGDMRAIEKIQGRVTKFVPALEVKSHYDCLVSSSLPGYCAGGKEWI